MLSDHISVGRGRQAAPRPREELLDLRPLDRVLAQLASLDLDYQRIDGGYAARCPFHVSDPGRLNFEVIEVDRDKLAPSGGLLPAGTVLLRCHAYGDLAGPDGCTQDNVIAALGLWPCDLYPGRGVLRRDDLRGGLRLQHPLAAPSRPPLTEEEIDAWEEKAECFEAALIAGGGRWLDELAGQLGVPAWALARFHVGWRCPDRRQVGEDLVVGRCWTIPERDAHGRVTAINRRYEDRGKQAMCGGRRGLYIPDGWRDMPGPVYCPEGFSDAAALVAIGACAVGRPNVGGGAGLLAELLRGDPRPVVVLGENDGRWDEKGGKKFLRRPGYDGAVAACTRLRQALRRSDITAMMPPEGYKDVRAFITKGGRPS